MASYPEVPIFSFSKIATNLSAVRSIVKVVRDPKRLDLVLHLYKNLYSNEYLESLSEDLAGESLNMATELQLPVDSWLAGLPEGSLGKEFLKFKEAGDLRPEEALIEANSEHSELYLAFSKTHDIWHVLTGFDSSPEGELGLQAFYLAQHASPLAALLISLGLFRSLFFGLQSFVSVFHQCCKGWMMGRAVKKKLITIDWSKRWTQALDDIRLELNICIPEAAAL